MISKYRALFIATVIAMTFSGCHWYSGDTSTIATTESTSFSTTSTLESPIYATTSEVIPTEHKNEGLDEKVYWEKVKEEIDAMLLRYNLYVFRIDMRAPYMNYHVEFGKSNDTREYTPIGLTKDECFMVIESVQDELMQIIASYQLEDGDSIWRRPSNTTIGLHVYSRFVNNNFSPSTIDRCCIADYQIDLLEYYYGNGDSSFIIMDSVDASPWEKFEVYTP